jgi:drug/metabolite transporter (DMT)-like permease
VAGALGMTCVGGSVAVSGELAHAPFCTAEAIRYALACVLLIAFARLTGTHLHLPRGAEWLWLSGIAVTGLVLFNVALVLGSRHAEPAVLGVAVACVPAMLALIGPLLEGARPQAGTMAAALTVTAGAVLVQGLGHADAIGIGFALVVFSCEAAFTLLAIPVLRQLGSGGSAPRHPRGHGPVGVSVHTQWLAAAMYGVLGLVREGPGAAGRLTLKEWLASLYLAVGVTAVAFVLWYTCVGRLGAARAGLLTGVAPIAAAISGVMLGGPAPGPAVWAGIAVVATGQVLGLRRRATGPRAAGTRKRSAARGLPPAPPPAARRVPGTAPVPPHPAHKH